MDIKNNFFWFKHNPDMVYLDSAATALKPYDVIRSIKEYVEFDCTNPHNTDSNFSYKVKIVMDETRELLAEYLNANSKNIVFTPGATFSLNMIADSVSNFLTEDDEIILTNAEHASNILPWFEIRNKKNLSIIFADHPIVNDEEIIFKNILDKITDKTKLIAFANGTNLIGTKINAESLSKKIKKINPNILIVVDATQYLSHSKMNLKNSNIDFVAGSAHKMMGPTGIGFMYISNTFFDKIRPNVVGGGMNHVIRKEFYTLMDGPAKFEAGTPNMIGIYGWNASLKFYKNNINQDVERQRIYDLKKYLDNELSKIDGIKIYNKEIESFITIFSYDNVFSQDLASYLGTKNIIVRSGLSCAKLADEIINYPHVVRISMHFYTSKKDIDKFLDVMKNYKKGDELNAII